MNLLIKLLESAHETYKLQLLDGHPIAEIQHAQVLVDTGATQSLGLQSSIGVGGQSFPLSKTFMGQNIRDISGMIGRRIDVVLGCDILSRTQTTMDVKAGILSFSREKKSLGGTTVPFQTVMSIPVISVAFGEQNLPVFFDTGAKLSYLASHLLPGCPVIGTANDFYPGFGEFETSLKRVRVRLDGVEREIVVGELPQLLEMSLLLGGAQGVLGSTILDSHVVTMNYAAKQLEFKAHSHAESLFKETS